MSTHPARPSTPPAMPEHLRERGVQELMSAGEKAYRAGYREGWRAGWRAGLSQYVRPADGSAPNLEAPQLEDEGEGVE